MARRLQRVMASITMATAAAPGFSPLLGSGLDHLFGWRSEFVFVAVFALCAGGGLRGVCRRNQGRRRQFPESAQDCRLLSRPASGCAVRRACQNRRSVDGRPVRCFLECAAGSSRRVWIGADHARPAVCRRCFPGVWRRDDGAGIIGAVRLYRAILIGLGLTVAGGAALLVDGVVGKGLAAAVSLVRSIFLFGVGIASPLSSAAALSPFGDKAGVAAALFGFSQMAGAACGASLAAVLASDPAIGLGIVLALTSLLALILHRWQRRTGDRPSISSRSPHPWLRLIFLLGTKCATSCNSVTRRRHRRDMVAQMLRGRPGNIRCIPSINCGSLAHTGPVFGQPKTTHDRRWASGSGHGCWPPCTESREQEAARVIRRHRDLIQNFQSIELPGRGMDPKNHA